MYSSTLENLVINAFGNSYMMVLLVFGVFAYICFKKKFGLIETIYVFMPLIIGVTAAQYLPHWIRGTLFMFIGALIGLAFTKKFLSTVEWYWAFMVVFVAMNGALLTAGYNYGQYAYSTNGLNMSLENETNIYINTPVGDIPNTGYMVQILGVALNFLAGGGVFGFLTVAGTPSEVMTLVYAPLAFIGLFAVYKILVEAVDLAVKIRNFFRF